MFPILTSRNRTINTLIIVKIDYPHIKEIVNGISLRFSIPKRPYFSLQSGQEQNILGHTFERRAY